MNLEDRLHNDLFMLDFYERRIPYYKGFEELSKKYIILLSHKYQISPSDVMNELYKWRITTQ